MLCHHSELFGPNLDLARFEREAGAATGGLNLGHVPNREFPRLEASLAFLCRLVGHISAAPRFVR